MKNILIISNEDTPDNPGDIRGEAYGLPADLKNIPNLCETVERSGSFKTSVLHHTGICRADELCPDAVILSGMFTGRAMDYSEMCSVFADEIAWIGNAKVPVFGICMGLQLICAAYGVPTVRMSAPEGEFGFCGMELLTDGAITAGLENGFRGLTMHRCEAERVPDGFMLLARSKLCGVQMIAHREKPVFGTQFHPELVTPEYPEAAAVLMNYLALI